MSIRALHLTGPPGTALARVLWGSFGTLASGQSRAVAAAPPGPAVEWHVMHLLDGSSNNLPGW